MFWIASLFAQVALLAVIWRWATFSFPALTQRRLAVAVFLVVLALAQTASRWTVVLWHVGNLVHTVLIVLAMTLAIAGIPIAVVHVVAWAVEKAARKASPAEPKVSSGAMTRRQVVEASAGVAFLGATGSMLGWGMVRGRHAFEIVDVPVRIAGLPRVLDGYTIAQISDIHTGIYVGERELDEGLERVRAARADLVVVTGDIVDFDPAYAPLVARKLSTLSVRDGVVAVPGNHDYYAGVQEVLSALAAAGIVTLVNDGRVLRADDGGGFALLGVDDLGSARYHGSGPHLSRALATVSEGLPRILLSHQPQTVDRWAGKVALQLSGHTHGGQINPGFRPADFILPYVAGIYRVRGTELYVNRGFGTVGPPSRVGAAPEVTRVVLVAA